MLKQCSSGSNAFNRVLSLVLLAATLALGGCGLLPEVKDETSGWSAQKLYPTHPTVDYAYYLKGLANFNDDLGLLGNLVNQDLSERDPRAARDAFLAFKELVTRSPDSKYAADSTARMKYLVNALANNEVHVAKYYMKREAWVAAANRAKEVLKTNPEAPALEEALAIMVMAYDKLKLTDLRDDAQRVLTLNFPDSKYAKGVSTEGKAWHRFWG